MFNMKKHLLIKLTIFLMLLGLLQNSNLVWARAHITFDIQPPGDAKPGETFYIKLYPYWSYWQQIDGGHVYGLEEPDPNIVTECHIIACPNKDLPPFLCSFMGPTSIQEPVLQECKVVPYSGRYFIKGQLVKDSKPGATPHYVVHSLNCISVL
jgi:hypothetical protein